MAIDADPSAFPTLDIVPPASPPLPRVQVTAEERAELGSMLTRLGIPPGRHLVLLNPNASDLLPLRRWSPARYVALAGRLLADRPDLWIAFTGAPDEAAPAEELVRQVGSPRCVSLAGMTTLRQLLVLYESADVLVTNDSGPGHFAALTGIDAVVLFGPETPSLFAALGDRSHPIWAGIGCSPCVNAHNNRQTACRDNRCMQEISVDQVVALTIHTLDRRVRYGSAITSEKAPGGPLGRVHSLDRF